MKLKLLTIILFITSLSFSQNFHDTQGKLEISSSGQTSYTLPIAMPTSVKNVAPVINLVYSSGQMGGIAGQGWNINAISNISRIATRLDVDGYIDGVDFDENDKLALDGQRLIIKPESGAYWGHGSIYETEVKSNTKIELKGSGETTYFIVTSPDGSRSWYGNYGGTNAADLTAFYIVRFEDTNGNYITYHYTNPQNKSLCIDEIKFSANVNGLTPLNSIKFNYKVAKRSEFAYVQGLKYEKGVLLDNIEVKTNNILFRKYQFTHIVDLQLGYEKISQIQEFNGALEGANPVLFDYINTQTNINNSQYTTTYNNNLNFNDTELSGDFDGDGRLDFTTNNQVFTKLFQNMDGATALNLPFVSSKRQKFTATILTDNKLNQFQSIGFANESINTTEFKVYNLTGNSIINSLSKTINIDNKVSVGETMNEYYYCGYQEYNCGYGVSNCETFSELKKTTNYLEGDFNGDGISEILIISNKNQRLNTGYMTYYPYDGGSVSICNQSIVNDGVEHFIVDFDPSTSSVLGEKGYVRLGNNSNILGGNEYYERRYVMDFNGDGKSDILILNEGKKYKIVSFTQLQSAPWIQVDIIGQGILDAYSSTKQILFGDFNGDGKTDIMLPDTEGGENHTLWHIYYSNPKYTGGSFFEKESHNITEYWPDTEQHYSTQRFYNNYYALDTNGDGKSDLVRVWRNYYKPNWTINDHDTQWTVNTFVNNIGNTTSQSTFTHDYSSPCFSDCKNDNRSPDLPIPIVSSYKHQGLNKELIMVRNHHNQLTYVDFTKDVSQDNLLRKVTSSGGNIVDEISYKTMESTEANNGQGMLTELYSSSNSVNYPNIEIKKIPSNYLVSLLKNTVNGVVKFQDFRYHGFVVNMHGLGTIGFTKTARSTWYQNASTKRVWSITENNPLWRGATQRSYTQLLNNGSQFAFVTSGDPDMIVNSTVNDFNCYTTNMVYHAFLNTQVVKDYLTNITTETSYTYDTPYFLPVKTVTKNFLNGTLQGTSTISTIFNSDISGTGANYYIGRPATINSMTEAYSDTFKTTESLYYANNRLIKSMKKGNTTEEKYQTEEFEYDAYGNITKKIVGATGYPTTVTPRTVQFTYDPTARFVKTTTDVAGLVSKINSYHPLYGLVLSATDPFNLTSTTEYDTWGKVRKATNYLNKSIQYAYTKSANEYTTVKTGDDGSTSVEISDALGRGIKSGVKNIDNSWSYKSVEYDFLGRKNKVSEPYFSTPSQWNTTEYDDYNRVITNTGYTGLVTTILYFGTTVVAQDGTKTTSSIKNANGHVVTSTDLGGAINYTYYANGSQKTTDYQGNVIAIEYDEWGRKKSLVDPSAGKYTYAYSPLGETIKETTPNGATEFVYDAVGKLMEKKIVGNLTNTKTTYYYDDASQLLIYSDFKDNIAGVNTAYFYEYDNYKRLIEANEGTAPYSGFVKYFTYDEFGRQNTIEYNASSATKNSSRKIKNTYKNGYPWQVIDVASGKVLWQTDNVNARGQLTKATMGNGVAVTNQYDDYGFPSQFKHNIGATDMINLYTNFEPKRGNLTSRFNNSFNWSEAFQYDELDRLTHFNSVEGQQIEQSYDERGRITQNELGQYNYDSAKPYQNNSIDLNAKSAPYYQHREGIFNDDMEGHNKWSEAIQPLGISYDNSKFKTGKSSLKVSASQIPVNAVHSDESVYINNANDTQYTFSGWIYSDNPTGRIVLFMYKENEVGHYTQVEHLVTELKNDWVYVERTVTVPANIKRLNIRVDNMGIGNVWFDDLRIRKTSNTPNATRQLNVSYNVFKGPVQIEETGVDKISFLYNDSNGRSSMFYGGLQDDKTQRPLRKHYSSDGSMEIKENIETGEVEFITYIGGDGYTSPVVLKSNGTTAEYLYLHRDYQGTILAVSNEAGAVIEKRLFDAWGSIIKVQNGQGRDLAELTVLDRGYTGHEHLQSVGLIHMNGRLYDPKLHRFLQPDNYVQDPSNTQNYNRYSYAYNNPFKYSDPSGEFLLTAVLVGAAIAATTYTLTALLADVPFTVGGLIKASFVGAISGAVTFGIGTGTSTIAQFGLKLSYQALAHGTAQGLISGIQGGNFWTGFASASISSIVGSVWSGGKLANGSTWKGVGGSWGSGDFGTIAFGTVSGGAGAALTGGNFWQGAATGFTVTALNHAMHSNKDRKIIDNRLKLKGFDPDATANIYQSQLGSFAEDIFPDLMDKSGNPTFLLKDRIYSDEGGEAYGLTQSIPNKKGEYRVKSSVEISRKALTSYRLLAATIGHELNHVYHFNSGIFDKWVEKYGIRKANSMTEWAAQRWEVKVGGYPSQSIIDSNFYIMTKP
ncbi:RHS repeat-associated core domain-containing protein [Flavobacterium sp. '19STA2R22 D10 B1']|uniref:RHS repeat-associated core domain-containing protein n=1 Tax=Flavobacterium aerium TaxID=3037261 RepID=UPI00278C70D6|nr:RHS repeat-associated core domain-containing protein [Flavobacterium sp. '19STA2R22 D10 B1']